MYDDSEKKIEIVTKDGRSVTLSDKDRKIVLKTSNASIVVEDDKVNLETGTSVSLKAGSNLKIRSEWQYRYRSLGAGEHQRSDGEYTTKAYGKDNAAKQGDQIIAVDTHIVMVPSPSGHGAYTFAASFAGCWMAT